MPAMRNALMPFQLPEAASVSALTNPLMAGMQTYRQGMQQQFEGERALNQERMQQEKLDLDIDEREYRRRRQMIEDVGKAAVAADSEQDPARRAALHQAILSRHPEAATLPAQYRDPIMGPRLLRAEAGKARDDLDERFKLAQVGMMEARSSLYRSQAEKAAQPVPAPAAAPDPLAGAGLDDDGVIVKGSSAPSAYGQGTGETYSLAPRQMPEPMRLGGPRDDIDASMRLDEGRPAARGVQVAQATQAPAPWRPETSQMDQAKARMFGPVGVTSPEVPGVVTDAGRNRRVDPAATREAQGQRAVDAATPEQQDRLRRFRDAQEQWSWVYKRQPRAGYYYGTDGREQPLTDKNFKGDREAQAVALLNLKKIDQAYKTLEGMSGFGPGYLARAAAGALNIGDVGQAFVDMKQAAMGIAYALSGKTVAVAEMKNFMDAYGPGPADTIDRIKTKTERLKQFYHHLITASRGGESYEMAFAKASAKMGITNPDGSPMGAPAAASGGQAPPPDLTNVPTEELLRRLQGAR